MEPSQQQDNVVVIVIACPRCGSTLREQFDRGTMICDRSGREIPAADVLAALQDLERSIAAAVPIKAPAAV